MPCRFRTTVGSIDGMHSYDAAYRSMLFLYAVFVYASLATFMRAYPHAYCRA